MSSDIHASADPPGPTAGFTKRCIDLNADVGEIPAALADGSEARLLALVSSANIACGGHAGDAETMAAVLALCRQLGVVVGAHPSYPDREHFGRLPMSITSARLAAAVASQVGALMDIAAAQSVVVRHIKPHGALYNVAVKDQAVATAIARGVRAWRDRVVLVGLAGSEMLTTWRRAGFRVAGEAFADRRYEPDGSLRSREHPDALILDPATAAQQAIAIAVHHRVRSVTGATIDITAETLCLHGDTPNAVALANAVRQALENHGVAIRPVE
jgi:UPF0271 protein